MTTLYDFEAQQIDGKTVPLAQYKGHPLLIVNTASACGFTPQFAGLEELHKAGLIVRYAHADLDSLAEACECALAMSNTERRLIYDHFNAHETVGAVVTHALVATGISRRSGPSGQPMVTAVT